jgi:hypothetical protein
MLAKPLTTTCDDRMRRTEGAGRFQKAAKAKKTPKIDKKYHTKLMQVN